MGNLLDWSIDKSIRYVIEQMTYLMFIRHLDDADNLHAKEAAMLGLPHKSIFADEVQ